MKIKRALISVSDKSGIVEMARTIASTGAQILSTGGTAQVLRKENLAITDVSQYTGFPEMMDGRLKTLHPKIHGGLLYRRGNPEDEKQTAQHEIQPIDLLIVNLYPFEDTVKKNHCSHDEAIEQIDIGGPAMLRSAAKNYQSVAVIIDPKDYQEVAEQLTRLGEISLETRQRLATKVFETTSRYDSAIAHYLSTSFSVQKIAKKSLLPQQFSISLPRAQELRYGENPHQKAALYGDFNRFFHQLHGKELSYNNILDLTAAVELIAEFSEPTVAILKHSNPCGVGQDEVLAEAWEKALATDRQAPFGGVIAINRPVDLGLAQKISEIFSEVIIAPSYASDALVLLEKRKNLRLILQKIDRSHSEIPVGFEMRYCPGGLLVQEKDLQPENETEWKIVTHRSPTELEMKAMRFAWHVVKHVKSNAIVYASNDRTLGIGAGQMSRVDAARISIWKASEAGLSLDGSVVASDAFFPFPDGLIAAAKAGASAAIQPGGSVKDPEVIKAADEYNLAMIFTQRRHFRH